MSRQDFRLVKNWKKWKCKNQSVIASCLDWHSRMGLYLCKLTKTLMLGLVCDISDDQERVNRMFSLQAWIYAQKDSCIFQKLRLSLNLHTMCVIH